MDFKVDSNKETPEISFRISDSDNAFKQGYLTVMSGAGEEVFREIISAETLHTFKLRMDEGQNYSFNFVVTYDLDHDYFDAADFEDQLVVDDTIFTKDITFTRDYNFIASDFALTEKVSDEDDLVLTFRNGYDSYYKVNTVVVGSAEYPVEGPDENGVYRVVIPKSGTKGVNTVTVEAVTLENDFDTRYTVNKELTYIYLKNAPVINDIGVVTDGDTVSVTADVTDNDGAVDKISVTVKDADGNVVMEVTADENGAAQLTLEELGEYTLEVSVTYDLGDYKKETLSKTYGETIVKSIEITDIRAELSAYVGKGERIGVFFTISDNSSKEPTDILLINGMNSVKLPLEKQADGTYKVSFNAPDVREQDGIAEYEVIGVYYGDTVVDVDYTFSCKITKSAPTVANDHIDDTSDKAVLYFDLIDDDDAFVSGRIIVKETDGTFEFVLTTRTML